jgi:hypothetical protein
MEVAFTDTDLGVLTLRFDDLRCIFWESQHIEIFQVIENNKIILL